MNRSQLEKIYEVNGLEDYKLNTTENLLKCHGIDYKNVDGYNRLDDVNRHIYKTFIINIFNALGLDSRATLIPKGIYFVEDIQYLCKLNPADDTYIVKERTILSVDRSGLKSVLYNYTDEEYEGLPVLTAESSNYLRFEYEHHERYAWLHVIKNGEQWY